MEFLEATDRIGLQIFCWSFFFFNLCLFYKQEKDVPPSCIPLIVQCRIFLFEKKILLRKMFFLPPTKYKAYFVPAKTVYPG